MSTRNTRSIFGGKSRVPRLGAALAFLLCACTGKETPPSDTGDGGTTEESNEASADASASSAGSAADGDSLGSESASSGESGSAEDECPAGIDGMQDQKSRLVAPGDWPWSEPPEETVDVSCTPVGFAEGALELACSPESASEPYTFSVVSNVEELQEALEAVLEYPEVLLSFSGPIGFAPGSGIGAYHSLRTPEGGLLLLAVNTDLGASLDAVGPDGWIAPFEPFAIEDPPCDFRPAIREGADLEKPIGLVVEGDAGPITVFDRGTSLVQADGDTYNVLVFDAFERGESGCAAECIGVETNFAIARTAG